MSVLIAAAAVAQSIVLVAMSVQGGARTGTGFAISSTATATRILTANHVVEGTSAPLVFIGGPRGQRYVAAVVRSDRLRDIALLEIPVGGFPTVTLSNDAPVSGTNVEAEGFPTLLEPAPSASPQRTPSPLPLRDLKLTAVTGKIDGQAEQGESVLTDLPLTHGDSGAPLIDVKSNRVVGMVLGIAAGYGVARWMSGDGLGVSVVAIDAFLNQTFEAVTPPKPTYAVAMTPNADADVAASWAQLASSAGFVIADAGKSDPCRSSLKGPPTANAVITEESDTSSLSINVSDCSGAQFYQDGLSAERGGFHDLIRLVGRAFLGFIDTHPAQWASLLKYGIAVDPQTNPYLALMSVQRTPEGQLVVAHTFRDGPADAAGLRPGDAILKIDGRPTRALGDPFVARLLNQPSITLLLDRDEREFTVRLTLRRFSVLTASGPIPH